MELRYILIIFLLFTIRNVLVSALTYGMCTRSKRVQTLQGTIYYRNTVCCNNFKNVDGVCTECSPGFVSRAGGTCYPCPGWSYGYRCMNWCRCKENERCHNVYGCIEMFSTKDVTTKMTLTTEPSVSSQGLKTTNSIDGCLGMVKTDIFIYSLFGVGTFIIICFSIGCFCVLNKSHKENINPNSEIDQNVGVNNRIYEVDNDVERSQFSRERATDNEYIAML